MTDNVTRTADKTPADAAETTTGARIYRPLADIVETDEGVTLMLEMPGVAPDDVDITLEQRVLTVRGKISPTQPETLRLAYAECGEGDYERAFSMGDDFDPDKIDAALTNGVLTLTRPRAAAAKPTKIAVKAA